MPQNTYKSWVIYDKYPLKCIVVPSIKSKKNQEPKAKRKLRTQAPALPWGHLPSSGTRRLVVHAVQKPEQNCGPVPGRDLEIRCLRNVGSLEAVLSGTRRWNTKKLTEQDVKETFQFPLLLSKKGKKVLHEKPQSHTLPSLGIEFELTLFGLETKIKKLSLSGLGLMVPCVLGRNNCKFSLEQHVLNPRCIGVPR